MKKISRLLIIVLSFMFVQNIKAESIDSINMDVYVDKNGDAHVTEVWEANPTKETEYYHAYYNIQQSKIEDFKVRDESGEYTYIDWDIDASLSDKARHYGFNYANDGVELCFGKSSYGKHTYTLTYTIKNFVYNTKDGKQVMYLTMLNKINPAPKNVMIFIKADEMFSRELPVWGYGNYGGYAFVGDDTVLTDLDNQVHDGEIVLANDHLTNTDYMTFLAVFDEPIFNATATFDYTIDELKDMAEKGSTKYSDNSFLANFFAIFINAVIWISIIAAIIYGSKPKFGTKRLKFSKDKKKIPKDVNMFRDLPCGKDIKRAYWIAAQYGMVKKKTDYLGAVLLKWIKEKKVTVQNDTKGTVFKKEDTKIVFNTPLLETDDDNENKLYQYMYEASKDGILENKEFETWCSKHYSKMLDWFDKVIDSETENLTREGKISLTGSTYMVDDSMYEEALKVAGLKKFFAEFDNMTDKEAIDVMLWEEYLMYAQIFGVAAKVAKQFKKLYPDVITDNDYNTFIYINHVSYSGISSASAARSRAESYSSGGGGFSSGGGGFGSIGGGGGGFGGGSR